MVVINFLPKLWKVPPKQWNRPGGWRLKTAPIFGCQLGRLLRGGVGVCGCFAVSQTAPIFRCRLGRLVKKGVAGDAEGVAGDAGGVWLFRGLSNGTYL